MAFFYLMELTNQNSNYEKEHGYCAHSPCRYDRFYTFSIMKKLTFITVSLLIVVAGLLSCKKEYSCEGCIGNNHPPLAVAGADTVITLPTDSVLLNGGKSSDPDGKISAWQWTKITGPASFTIVSATAAIQQ